MRKGREIRRLSLVSLGCLLFAARVEAAPLFTGSFEVFDTGGVCAEGEARGTIGLLRFQQTAAGVGLTFALPSEVRSYFLAGSKFSNEFQSVDGRYFRFDFTTIGHPIRIRFTTQSPKNIGNKTQLIQVIGEVDGFTSEGCISKFRGTLVRWFKLG
jgi:hypothetical protein